MSQADDRSSWHKVSVSLPFPTADQADLVRKVVSVDKVLRPSELTRTFTVNGSTLDVLFQARTVTQARVALDHTLSDIQLVVQTMHQFGPTDQYGDQVGKKEEAASIEVGLKGSWEGRTK